MKAIILTSNFNCVLAIQQLQCFDTFITFSVKISHVFSLTFREPVYFALTAIADLLCILPVTVYRRIAVVVMSYYVMPNQMFLYIYNMYIYKLLYKLFWQIFSKINSVKALQHAVTIFGQKSCFHRIELVQISWKV